ncbi:MAG: hypothetical protein RLZZ502_730 [Pseudomonadota bacterium]|jgi:pimeloyl-ACP methyl ester carboxylesterase
MNTQHLASGHTVSYLERAGSGKTVVLLHGIGSNASNWQALLDVGIGHARLIAWNAPGYLDCTALAHADPTPAHYAQVLAEFLSSLHIHKPILVGHSLGALMAGAYAAVHPVEHLLLLSPAQGYAAVDPALRAQKRDDRLSMLHDLGLARMAQERSGALLRPDAPESERARVVAAMLALNEAGYTQATHCLANGHLLADALACQAPITVACGELDAITPPKGARRLAEQLNASYVSMGEVGHMLAIETPTAVRTLIHQLL